MKNASTRRPVIRLNAHAKINLALAVAPPRDDGMHPIASWMTRIALADDLLITRLEDDRLSRYAIVWADDAPSPTPIDWSITKDLGVRAHQALEKEVGTPLPVQVRLDKRIPVGAGLGGGSSDAASMLLGVSQLFDLDVPPTRLAQIAHELGSDVPFFLGTAPALVSSIGEDITFVPESATDLIVVFPPCACATGTVYRMFDESPSTPDEFAETSDRIRACALSGNLTSDALCNHLLPAACKAAPDLEALMQRAVSASGLPVHLSGSGSAFFILAPEDPGAQAQLLDNLRSALDSCAIILTHTRGAA